MLSIGLGKKYNDEVLHFTFKEAVVVRELMDQVTIQTCNLTKVIKPFFYHNGSFKFQQLKFQCDGLLNNSISKVIKNKHKPMPRMPSVDKGFYEMNPV